MPKVSIIVPVYNVEQYLRECLESISAQTFTDWECLLIDDGSPDNSGAFCDEFASHDCRFKVFHKPNGGVSSARNLGLDNANGEWVTFIDSDDLVSETFLENLCSPFEEGLKVDFIHAGCSNYRNGKIVSVEQKYEYTVSDDKSLLFNQLRGLTVSKLFCLEIINSSINGSPLRFDENLKSAEDMAFTLDYILSVGSYVFLPETGYFYRRDNESSITHKGVGYTYEQALYSFQKLYNSVCAYRDKYSLNEDQCRLRYEQRGRSIIAPLFSLYINGKSRKFRLHELKYSFTTEQYKLYKYVKKKVQLYSLILNLLCIRMYRIADTILFVLWQIKKQLIKY